MKWTLGLAFVAGCTGGEVVSDGSWARPPTDIQWPEDNSMSDVFHADGVGVEYFLSKLPIPETMDVSVKDGEGVFYNFTEAVGDPPVGDFTYNPQSNSVRFLRYIPPPESLVLARYTPLSPPPSR